MPGPPSPTGPLILASRASMPSLSPASSQRKLNLERNQIDLRAYGARPLPDDEPARKAL